MGETMSWLKDFATFRNMITPYIIMWVYWVVATIIAVLGLSATIYLLVKAKSEYIMVVWFFVVPFCEVVWRMFCEWIIVFFRIHEELKK